MPINRENSAIEEIATSLNVLLGKHGIKNLQRALKNLPSYQDQIASPPSLDDVSIEDAIEDFLSESKSHVKRWSATTKKTYRVEANLFLRFCNDSFGKGAKVMAVLTPEVISDYLDQWESSKTRNKKVSFLRTLIRVGCADYLGSKITDLLLRKKGVLSIKTQVNDLPKAFTRDQIIAMLNQCRFSQNGFRNYTIIWTFLSSGIRLDELVQLKIGDILFEHDKIRIRAKRNKNELIERVISQEGLRVLKEYIEFSYGYQKNSNDNYNSFYIFSNDGGNSSLSPRTVQKMVENLIINLKTKGIIEKGKKLSVHSFRHSFAIYALESGIDIYTISKLMGHTNVSSTEVYLKMFDYQLKEAIEKHPLANWRIRGGD